MKNINRNLIVAFICGFLFLCAAFGDASAQTVAGGAAGSYQQSCQNIKTVDNGWQLIADCRTKSGGWNHGVALMDVFLCSGDISNNNGALTCAKNTNSQQFNAAKAAFASATTTVIGRPHDTDLYWIRYVHKIGEGQKFRDGINFGEAMAIIKKFVAENFNVPVNQLNQKMGEMILHNAFMEVYGTGPNDYQKSYWLPQIQAQKAWHATIVGAEIGTLNNSKAERTKMLHRVYQTSMGRDADQGSLDFWLPRKDHYRQIVEANRTWLYSTNGEKDLLETVTRAHASKLNPETKNKPLVIKTMADSYKKDGARKIYVEMVAQK